MFQLSTDVIFVIFNYLTIQQTETLINNLKMLVNPRTSAKLEELIICAYQRIYLGGFIVYSNKDDGSASIFDKSITIGEFERQVNLPNTFFKNRPQFIQFVFIRHPTDYHQFVKDLHAFSEMGKSTQPQLVNYLQTVIQYGLYIHGNTVLIESPNSFSVAILKVLICISNDDPSNHLFGSKLTSLTIKSTDIGQYYTHQWCKLFSRFTNVTKLDLSDNAIRQNIYQEIPTDILGCFQWPPKLTHLNLDSNFVAAITDIFLNRLPKTLEELRLADNVLLTVGIDEEFVISEILPNLQRLVLDNNTRLTWINPRVFNNATCFQVLSIKHCNLEGDNLQQLARFPFAVVV